MCRSTFKKFLIIQLNLLEGLRSPNAGVVSVFVGGLEQSTCNFRGFSLILFPCMCYEIGFVFMTPFWCSVLWFFTEVSLSHRQRDGTAFIASLALIGSVFFFSFVWNNNLSFFLINKIYFIISLICCYQLYLLLDSCLWKLQLFCTKGCCLSMGEIVYQFQLCLLSICLCQPLFPALIWIFVLWFYGHVNKV